MTFLLITSIIIMDKQLFEAFDAAEDLEKKASPVQMPFASDETSYISGTCYGVRDGQPILWWRIC